MRFVALLSLCLALPVLADEPLLRPSASLIFKQPELLRPGSCVIFKEGGGGWVMTEPTFFLRGKVLAAEVRARRLAACPEVPGKTRLQYTRDEFNRLALAYPCLATGETEREAQVGVVRLAVDDWETPHSKAAANAGRLYRGMFIDKPLRRGLEIELEADLLEACTP